MSESPMKWEPEADVPLKSLDGENNEQVLEVAANAADFQDMMRQTVPPGPDLELALRYADLAVQAARGGIHGTGSAPTGSPEADGPASSPA